MIKESNFDDFWNQFSDLRSVVLESNNRILKEDPDMLFSDFSNVFIKSYLVSSCSVLEGFIQELVFCYVEIFKEKVKNVNIPHNLIHWNVLKDKINDKKDFKFSKLDIDITKSLIEEKCSANFHKTKKLFESIGVDLSNNTEITKLKEQVSSKIDKRNKIVHHNDNALDLSFADVIDAIDIFTLYAKELLMAVQASSHLRHANSQI